MRQQFSTSTVAYLTGATRRQMDYWSRKGLLRPSIRDAKGRGSKRRYSFRDIVAAQTIVGLRERKCPLQKISTAIAYLKRNYPDESNSKMLAKLTLLTDGTKVYILTDDREVMEVLSRQYVWSAPLGLLITELQQKVSNLPTTHIQEISIRGKKYHLTVIRDVESGTYTAQCKELPGAIEQGPTIQDAISNGKAAVRSALAFMAKHRTTRIAHAEAL